MYPVSPDKEHNIKSRKSKVCLVLQSPVSTSKTSSQMVTSHRPKQAKHLFEGKEIQNVNSGVHKGLSYSRRMGLLERPFRCLFLHSHPPNRKKVPMVHPQIQTLPIHLCPLG